MRGLSSTGLVLAAVVLAVASWLWLLEGPGGGVRLPWVAAQPFPTAAPFQSGSLQGMVEESPTPTPMPSSTPTASPSATPTPSPTLTPTPTPIPPTSTPTPAPTPHRRASVALPERLVIPSLRIDAVIEHVGLTRDGAMDTPADPDQVAWYRLGPRPGQPGNAALTGHVDWAGRVRAFWKLRDLEIGDPVVVVAKDGAEYEFEVRWMRWYDAATAPLEEVFGSSSESEITLITCGGLFDPRTRQYLSRLVVRGALR